MTDFSVQNLFFLFYIAFDHFTTNHFLFQWIILISDSFVNQSNHLLVFSLLVKEIIFLSKNRNLKASTTFFSSIFFLFSSFFFLFKCLFVYSSSLQKRRKFVIASFFHYGWKKKFDVKKICKSRRSLTLKSFLASFYWYFAKCLK